MVALRGVLPRHHLWSLLRRGALEARRAFTTMQGPPYRYHVLFLEPLPLLYEDLRLFSRRLLLLDALLELQVALCSAANRGRGASLAAVRALLLQGLLQDVTKRTPGLASFPGPGVPPVSVRPLDHPAFAVTVTVTPSLSLPSDTVT